MLLFLDDFEMINEKKSQRLNTSRSDLIRTADNFWKFIVMENSEVVKNFPLSDKLDWQVFLEL